MSGSAAEAILACIRRYPGIHLRGIEREIGTSAALVHYHVKRMEAAKLVRSAFVDGYLRFYPREAEKALAAFPGREDALSLLREEVPLQIVLILLDAGEVKQSHLVEELELAKSTVSYQLDKLVKAGIVERKPSGRGENLVRVRDARGLRRTLTRYSPTAEFVERFRDLWDDFYGR